MATQHTVESDSGLTLADLAVFGAALVVFVTTWALFVTAPPEGLVSPYGMVVSVAAGAYLLFVILMYLK